MTIMTVSVIMAIIIVARMPTPLTLIMTLTMIMKVIATTGF